MIEIVNVVGSGDIGVELDIAEVAADLPVPHTEYDPDNYHGIYVRLVNEGPLITLTGVESTSSAGVPALRNYTIPTLRSCRRFPR